jgi:hypothetical protein
MIMQESVFLVSHVHKSGVKPGYYLFDFTQVDVAYRKFVRIIIMKL